MTTFGSTEEDPIPKEEIGRALGRRDKATLDGVLQEMDIVKQKLEHCYEKLSRMTGLYQTMRGEVEQLRTQYALLANLRVNHGPTVRGDGAND